MIDGCGRTTSEGLGEIRFVSIAKGSFSFGKLRYVFVLLIESAGASGITTKLLWIGVLEPFTLGELEGYFGWGVVSLMISDGVVADGGEDFHLGSNNFIKCES